MDIIDLALTLSAVASAIYFYFKIKIAFGGKI